MDCSCLEFILMSCFASYIELCCMTHDTEQDEQHEVELMVQPQTEPMETLEMCAAATSSTKIDQSDEDFVIVE